MPKIKKKKPGGDSLHTEENVNFLVDKLDESDSNVHIDLDNCVVEENDPSIAPAVVKMKLNTFCTNPDIQRKLQSIVKDANRLIAEAYLFANFHIARLLETKKEIPKIDRNFYYRCLMAVGVNQCRSFDEHMVESISQFDKLRLSSNAPKIQTTSLNQLLADLSIIMGTMGSNHVWMNIKPRILRFLSWKFPEVKKCQRSLVIDALLYKPTKPLETLFPEPKMDPVVPKKGSKSIEKAKKKILENSKTRVRNATLKEVASHLREIMPLPDSKENSKNAAIVMNMFFHILRETEAAKQIHDQNTILNKKPFRGRIFSLLPVKSGFTTSHIPISNMMMLSILKAMKLEEFKGDGRGEKENFASIWKRHFNLNLVETQNRRFGCRIVTDGKAVSILMNKSCCLVCPRPNPNVEELRTLLKGGDQEYISRFVGVDPGGTDIVTVADKNGNIQSYSSKQYYNVALFDTSRHRTTNWNKETIEMLKPLEKLTIKTSSIESLSEYIKVYLSILVPMLDHRISKGYRNMRFLRFTSKKKAINSICEMIAPKGMITVVGYGDWKGFGSSPISRRCAGPLQEIKLQLQNMERVRMNSVVEHKSSITCHCCFNRLTNMKATQTKYRNIKLPDGTWSNTKQKVQNMTKIHKVLHCQNSQTISNNPIVSKRCGSTWNRDTNASKNILMLLMLEILGMPRPEAFCRSVQVQ